MLLIATIFKLLMCDGFIKIYVAPALLSIETQLIKDLLHNYSPDSHPVINPNSQTVIKIGIELVQLLDILERDQIMIIKIWIRLGWKNELLTWLPSKWENISSIDINPDLVWIPDLILFEEIDKEMSKGTRRYHNRIKIDANGDHYWTVPLIIKSSCAINVHDFPFDHQTCSLKFASWLLDETKFYLISDNRTLVSPKYYINSSEWDLKNVSQKPNSLHYPCCHNHLMDMTYTFTFRRKFLYYVLNLIVPCILLIIIVLFSFVLPSDCIERINIIVTVLLAFVVFLQMMDMNLPKCSNSTPVLSVFYLTAIVESVGSIIGTCIVMILYHRGTEEKACPVPEWIRWNILKVPKTISEGNSSFENPTNPQENNNCSEIINAKSSGDITIETLHSANCRFANPNNPSDGLPELCFNSNVKRNNSIVKERCENESVKREWQLIAKIFDRFVFGSLLLFSVGSFSVIILPACFKSFQQSNYLNA